MNSVVNQLLNQQSLNNKQPNEEGNKETTEETPEKYIMSLGDWCVDSEDKQIEEVLIGYTLVIKSSPKDYNLCNKGAIPSNSSYSPKTNASLGKIIPLVPALNPSTPIPTNSKSNTIVSTNNKKYSTSNPVVNNINPNNPTTNNKANNLQPNTTTNKPETHALEYSVIEYMKKTKANISMYDICTLPQQCVLLPDTFNFDNTQKKTDVATNNISKTTKTKAMHTVEIKSSINASSIGAYLKFHIPPFLLTYEIFNFNVHNCLVHSWASSNIMPYFITHDKAYIFYLFLKDNFSIHGF
jgi:hypothetical protein